MRSQMRFKFCTNRFLFLISEHPEVQFQFFLSQRFLTFFRCRSVNDFMPPRAKWFFCSRTTYTPSSLTLLSQTAASPVPSSILTHKHIHFFAVDGPVHPGAAPKDLSFAVIPTSVSLVLQIFLSDSRAPSPQSASVSSSAVQSFFRTSCAATLSAPFSSGNLWSRSWPPVTTHFFAKRKEWFYRELEQAKDSYE